MSRPSHVTLVEVGPRDGLQGETAQVPTRTKIALIDRLARSGLRFIEATSFVSPKWVPQMADAAAVMSGIARPQGVTFVALTPNLEGAHTALESGAGCWAVFAAASETFSQRNTNCSIAESLKRFEPVLALAEQSGIPVRGYVSCVAGCPYEGPVPPAKVAEVAAVLSQMGVYQVSLGDTIGIGTPRDIARVLEAVMKAVPAEKLAIHCHDTYGRAIPNIHSALACGVSVVDCSVAGLGGCPYAPGAAGNVATEDVLEMLENLGIETGVDYDSVSETAAFILAALGRRPRMRRQLEHHLDT